MATAVATRTAREYLRVSKGKGGRARSITDQHRDNVASEQDHGPWTWGEAYADTGSASRYKTRERDGFERLTADLTSGAFGEPGTVLVLWEISRLARETGRGVALIDACEAGGILIHVTSHERPPYDPRNYSDRHSLIGGINDAEKEAGLLSKRTKRGTDSALAEGKFHGKRPFGYARDYEIVDGRSRPVRQYPDPVEGPLVIELFERVAGWGERKRESIRAVSVDWATRGIVGRQSGRPLSPQSLRSMLVQRLYIGERMHQGTARPGNWPALIEQPLFDAVQRLLADPTRKTHTTTAVRHVLTGTVKCDVCGSHVTARTITGTELYVCHAATHVKISKAELDAYLIGDTEDPGEILGFLASDDVYAALSTEDDSGELKSVRTQLASMRDDLKEFEDAEPARTLAESRERSRSVELLESEIKELERREHSLTAPNPLQTLFPKGPAETVAARWERTDIGAQRAIAALLLAPDVMGQVRIRRVADSASEAAQDRIRWVIAER